MKQLRKAGRGVEEALAEIKGSSYKGHGPVHLAALSAKPVMCKYLIKDLKLDVNAGGDDGSIFLFASPHSLIKFIDWELDCGVEHGKLGSLDFFYDLWKRRFSIIEFFCRIRLGIIIIIFCRIHSLCIGA